VIGAILQALSLFSMVLFLGYVATIVVPYVRHPSDEPGDASSFEWHIFIPARDEEVVIAGTVTRLLRDFPATHVWVVDDASEDRTAQVVLELARDPRAHLVQRHLPNARTGKGDALNAAYDALLDWLPTDHNPERVIVGVVDADGSLAPDVLDLVAGARVFGDQKVGAAQISVRMSNRLGRADGAARSVLGARFAGFLVRMQDLEFVGTISAMQMLREKTGSVGLGGNGQFTRLSVLNTLAAHHDAPWHGALLEDYELGLHILLAGYQNRFVFGAEVEQEAVESVRRLVAQRARWAQGAMQCSRKYLTPILQSRHLSAAGALEAAYFLVAPWLQLFGVLYWPSLYAVFAVKAWSFPGGPLAFAQAFWPLAVVTLMTGVLPFVVWGPLYRRVVDPKMGLVRSLLLGLGYSAYLAYSYPTTLRAFGRTLAGRTGWAKTRRNAEPFAAGSIAIEA
jgi:cellulose synthase/poly-beta-1,6-N-acetylglucosamine synthase-like glycosyltransferase